MLKNVKICSLCLFCQGIRICQGMLQNLNSCIAGYLPAGFASAPHKILSPKKNIPAPGKRATRKMASANDKKQSFAVQPEK